MKIHSLYIVSVLFLCACLANGEEQAAPMHWEYKIWVQPDSVNEISGVARIENELNDLGEQGWELVAVIWKKHSDRTSPDGRAIHYFKRALPSVPTVDGSRNNSNQNKKPNKSEQATPRKLSD
jgi:hypothetical protein